MNRRAFRKQAPSFFAAGPEFARALGVLSDGAFKLFAHVCLHAERVSGKLVFERAELASRLGKSCSVLGRHLRELVRAGVCELQAAPNQHRASALVVCEAYWPYRGEPGPHQAVPEADRQRYVASVREAFLGPACGPADARLAAAWHSQGIPLDTIRHAILLGCVRKSLALLERPATHPSAAWRTSSRSCAKSSRSPSPPATGSICSSTCSATRSIGSASLAWRRIVLD